MCEWGRFKKKDTRDVIACGYRWTEALRIVRSCHPEVTIILPKEKIQVRAGDDVRALIAPYVAIIRRALDEGKVGKWHGTSSDCCVKQVHRILNHYFHFYPGSITEPELHVMIEDMLYVHKVR